MTHPHSHGLTSEEAARRLGEHGPNAIERTGATPAWKLLLAQFEGPLVLLLLAACAVSAALREVSDAVAIAAILVVNAVVGFLQESRAEAAVLALRAMTAPRARVRRDGRALVVPAREVVPGDVLLLEAGDVVAADARLHEANALRTVEAPLTGESQPVHKRAEPSAPETPLAERHDHVFQGTTIAAGTGAGVVHATGMKTELGKIALLVQTAEQSDTPLQVQLAQVGRTLVWLCGGIVLVVAAVELLRGRDWLEVLLSSVSLAVAAVPEGLVAIVTVALAMGVQRLARVNVLVRHLPAVETLGSTTVICTDKTGTLTQGQMVLREVYGDRARVLRAAVANCDAELGPGGGVGDPTELALLEAGRAEGLEAAQLDTEAPRVEVHPFDTATRRMATYRADGLLYVKGAIEAVLPLCASGTEGVEREALQMSKRGLRVLAVAVGTTREEKDLELVGLVGIVDPPRPEAIEALRQATSAGIRTVMITGDHPTTAAAIAREMGIARTDAEVAERVKARATPEDKLTIVREWKSRGEVVAMTGDGVNDAPALREAHIGIAMGRTGTEVTREAADLVLADDNFASIVAGIREGRAVFANLRRTLVYLLAGNAGELALMLGAAAVGLPLPLLPLQLLWINLVTDGMPALALVAEPASEDLLLKPPRRLGERMLGRKQWRRVLLVGALEGALALATFGWALDLGLETARTLGFTTLVACEVLRAFAARNEDLVLWELGLTSNLRVLFVVLATLAVQIALPYIPWTRDLFGLASLPPHMLGVALALGLIPVSALEASKLLRRARPHRPLRHA